MVWERVISVPYLGERVEEKWPGRSSGSFGARIISISFIGPASTHLAQGVFAQGGFELFHLHHICDAAVDESHPSRDGSGWHRPARTARSRHKPPKAWRVWCTSSHRSRYRPRPARSHRQCPRSPLPHRRCVVAGQRKCVPRRTSSLSVAGSQAKADRSCHPVTDSAWLPDRRWPSGLPSTRSPCW